jgi:hypothetical protein
MPKNDAPVRGLIECDRATTCYAPSDQGRAVLPALHKLRKRL